MLHLFRNDLDQAAGGSFRRACCCSPIRCRTHIATRGEQCALLFDTLILTIQRTVCEMFKKKAASFQKQPFVTRCYTYLEMTLIRPQAACSVRKLLTFAPLAQADHFAELVAIAPLIVVPTLRPGGSNVLFSSIR